ncbi:MAG: catalase [Pseudonocardiaceae bacterium]
MSSTVAMVKQGMHVMEQYTGVVPGYRRAHAHGHGFTGYFEATPELAELTTAEHLQGGRIPTIVRLSNAAGNPYAPDLTSPRRGATLGLAIAFELASGARTTWGAPNISSFPARTALEFITLTTATRRSRLTHRPSLFRLLAFALRHRHLIPGLKSILSHPPVRSFSATQFNGLHAYYLVGANGTRQAFRYHWVPSAQGKRNVTKTDAALWPPQYLIEEMKQRLHRSPVQWDLVFDLAAAGDPTDDQTTPWPASRPKLKAGVLTLTGEHADQEAIERMVFDPTNVPPGIECSDDPILAYRSLIYQESHARRTSETRPVTDLLSDACPLGGSSPRSDP